MAGPRRRERGHRVARPATAPSTTEAERGRAVRRVLLGILVLNAAVFAAKAAYAVWSGSLAIASDAVHSLLDAAANVIGLVVLRFAHAPPDQGHPYGHRKLEVVAAAAIGVSVGIAAFKFAWDAIEALLTGRPAPHTSAVGFAVVGGTWLVNLVVARYEARRARELDSAFLAADAAHTASDLLVTAGVAASFTASYFGAGWADPLGALAIIVFVGRIAWGILKSNITVLIDRAVIDPERVAAVARAVDGVEDVHRVRSRGTEVAAQLDLHLLVDGDLPLREAHAIAHAVEDRLRATIPAIDDVTIHMEPSDDPEEGL
ncbi:MAG TPA: cation diffusion facilitator family transporter [Kofleriaceae bacterium]|nr:cation diffusion facilitator family transporter [Kofleriaceae bacterium]